MAKQSFILKNFVKNFIWLSIAIIWFQPASGSKIRVQIDGTTPIFTTDTKNPSFAMGFGIFKNHWTKYFNNPKFLTLINGLGQSYLRIGGTRADYARFIQEEEHNLLRKRRETIELFVHRDQNRECAGVIPDPVEFERHKIDALAKETLFYQQKQIGSPITDLTVNYTGQQFDELMTFVKCVGWDLIFNLNFLSDRKGKDWDPTNTIQLIKYSQMKQYFPNWELGNEPNSYLHRTGISFSAKSLAEGFQSLRYTLNQYPYWKNSKIIGPDISGFFRKKSKDMMKKFLKYAGVIMNATTFHQYYINSVNVTVKNFTDPEILNKLLPQVENAVSISRSANLPAWLGETSSSFGGGAKGLSDTYVAGFMWLDKLGMCAANGIRLVIRQTVIQGRYALLDDDFEPRPDYWLTLLYKRLVDSRVLKVTMFDQDGAVKTNRGGVRVYAHCSNTKRTHYQPGSVTLYYLNLGHKGKTLVLSDPLQQNNAADVYILTPSNKFLNSSGVNLNGNIIKMQSIHSLPPLLPRQIDLSSSQQIKLPAMSFGFIVLKSARVEACFK